LEQGFKSIAQTTAGGISKNDPTSIDDLKKQQELNEKLAKTLEGLTDVQKQNLIIQEKIKQLTTERNNKIKQEVILSTQLKGSLASLKAELNLISNAWNKASASERGNENVTGSLAQKKRILTEQIKKLEFATGSYSRNVGNYTKSFVTLAKGLGGITGIVGALGNAIGFNTDAIQNASAIAHEFVAFSKNVKHAKELETVATETNTVAQETNTVVTNTSTKATGVYGVALTVVSGIARATGLSMNHGDAKQGCSKRLASFFRKLSAIFSANLTIQFKAVLQRLKIENYRPASQPSSGQLLECFCLGDRLGWRYGELEAGG
jgi:chromosome segregation ATPase